MKNKKPKYKQKKVKVVVCRPMRKYCDCGSKVTDHHWLCNKCWGKKAKKNYWKKKKR